MPEYVILEKRPVVLPDREVDITRLGDEPDLVTGASVYVTWTPLLDAGGEPRLFDAPDEDAAIDGYAHDEEGALTSPGTYRAVARRNWGSPVTLRPKTVTDRIRGEE